MEHLDIMIKNKFEIIVKHGAVATDDIRCTEVALKVLLEGGNAVDAAVAASLCLGVVNPYACGVGGGAFMMIRTADGKAEAYDMREVAPKKAHKDMYAGNEKLKASGPLSIAVPGQLAGLHKAWKKHGRLPWSRLVKDAIDYASNGFMIFRDLAKFIRTFESDILKDEGLRSVFAPKGCILQVGDLCKNRKLAETLIQVSEDELESFYHGTIARNLDDDVKRAGGILSLDDMQSYQVKIKEPITTNFFGHKILGMPPSSSGGASNALILNILARYGSSLNASTNLLTHRTVEAIKHAFAMRMKLGDPDFVDIKDVLSDMLSPKFAEELQKKIDDNQTFDPSYYGAKWKMNSDHGTSHLSIIDRDRNAVSMTNTINNYFGARILSPSTGVILNNEMDDFSMPGINPPQPPANFVHPGKRPLSSMSPTIILQGGKLKAVVGGSGGPRIIASTTEIILNYFIKKMNPLASIIAPRFYHLLVPNVLYYEGWKSMIGLHIEVPEETRNFLRKRGHELKNVTGETALCQLLAVESYEAIRQRLALVSNEALRQLLALGSNKALRQLLPLESNEALRQLLPLESNEALRQLSALGSNNALRKLFASEPDDLIVAVSDPRKDTGADEKHIGLGGF